MSTRPLLASVVLALVACPATASPITWGAATGIGGDSDVSTNGTLVAAFNFNGAGTAVNAVLFQPFAVPGGAGSHTVGNYTISSNFFGFNPDTSSPNPPFSTLSAAYQGLLGTAAPAIANSTLTLGGLTVGQQYEIQVWSHNSADEFGYGVEVGDDGFANSVFLDAGGAGFLGQYVIGTFTADAASQLVQFSPSEVSNVNGFQLRLLGDEPPPPAVPEPASLAVFGLAVVGAAAVRRRRAVVS